VRPRTSGVGPIKRRALIAEFDNDIRRERQQDGINKAKAEGGEVWSQAASDDRSGAEDLGESCLDSKEPQVRAKASDRASAWLTIEIVHHRPPGADGEEISIKLQAVPSFEAYGRFLEAADPFVFWAEATRMTWFCWARSCIPDEWLYIPLAFLKGS